MGRFVLAPLFYSLCLAFLFFSFTSITFAGLVINEFSSASNPEWVELYNSDEQSDSLKNVVLFFDANSNTTQKVSFCDSDEIKTKSYKLINRPANSYWLSNTGDTLILKKDDDFIDSISYGSGQSLVAPSATQSGARVPDGGAWSINNNPSPQGDEASFVCPTETPIPTDTPIPTPSPTSSPAKTPTPTSKITITLASSILPTLKEKLDEDLSASETPTIDLFSPTSTPSLTPVLKTEVLGESDNNIFSKVLIGIGGVLLVSCGILGFWSYRKNKINAS